MIANLSDSVGNLKKNKMKELYDAYKVEVIDTPEKKLIYEMARRLYNAEIRLENLEKKFENK